MDSLLIDDNTKIAMLSSPIPSMEYLNSIFLLIWKKIEEISEKISKKDDVSYFSD